ncbi:MAG TPA: HAMP domain-containing sensor histidine kinase [Casimicrobiaceae bacterium]|nr:HAMP domain-containing sensor histidine kinase [Casimicrobiaceae bacterium]
MPKLVVPRLGLASFRRRIFFRGVFVLLVLATLMLALALLKEEKQRSYQSYEQSFAKTQAEIVARLRHPAGQLALLNPSKRSENATPLRPFVLPYAAIDFDDQNKAQNAVEMAGCSVQYPDGSSICVAIGNNAYAGGFIYLVGSFASGALVPRERGVLDLALVHRARITLDMRGETTRWIAPFELLGVSRASGVRGRLTGFSDDGGDWLAVDAKPVRDFRGWLWQSGRCIDEASSEADCPKRSFFSIRLPVDAFREALFQQDRPVWPPPDLDQVLVRMEVLAPGSERPLFDSNAENPTLPVSLEDLTLDLLPGETMAIRKLGGAPQELMVRKGAEGSGDAPLPWLVEMIRRLPVEGYDAPLERREVIATPVGSYEVTLTGDVRSVERNLGVVATRLSWFVGAMLAAIAFAWIVIEVGLIHRIAVLTKRAAAVSYNVHDPQVDKRIADLDVSDLRGSDELGILAGGLSDLLQRVKDDVKREHIRAEQERDMWHAVGHEIMSPLQSLMVLHGSPEDASHRYVQRMQLAMRALYGTASPSEAIEAATLQVDAIDLNEFLRKVAANAHFAGIENVRYAPLSDPVLARADEYSLEDAITHILRNADRYRNGGTAITVTLTCVDSTAMIAIHNEGPAIDAAVLDRIFEYGVSDPNAAASREHRGQGLFVARTYMIKMGGTISAANTGNGVTFTLALPRAK